MGLALAFWYSWLIAIGAVALLITIGGLLFEYYVGQNARRAELPRYPDGPLPPGRGPWSSRASAAATALVRRSLAEAEDDRR